MLGFDAAGNGLFEEGKEVSFFSTIWISNPLNTHC